MGAPMADTFILWSVLIVIKTAVRQQAQASPSQPPSCSLAMMSTSDAAVPLDDLLSGQTAMVDTRWGPLAVTVCGDRGRTPCLTLPDVGLNHRACWQSLLLAAGPKSLLNRNLCFYHVDVPGCQDPAADTPASFLPLSLARLAECLADVAQHFGLREVLGLGAGAGGYVMAQLAAENPTLLCGLVLVSPCCQRPGWWEWSWGKVAAWQLQRGSWSPSAKHYLVQRLYGELMQQAVAGESDLLQAFRRDCEELPPQAVAHYLRAALARADLRPLLPRLRCRLLLLFGGEALYRDDCLELATLVNKERFVVVEVPQVGGLVCQERPQEVVGVIDSFITALQLEGYALGPSLAVGTAA